MNTTAAVNEGVAILKVAPRYSKVMTSGVVIDVVANADAATAGKVDVCPFGNVTVASTEYVDWLQDTARQYALNKNVL